MISNVIFAIILATLAGSATILGGFLAFFVKRNSFKLLSFGLSFSAGVMLYVSFMEILPEAKISMANNTSLQTANIIAISAFFVGIILSAIIDKLFPEHISGDEVENKNDSENFQACICNRKHFKSQKNIQKIGIFTAIALTIHNFPEGLSVFISGVDNISLGTSIALAIALHNIPEGISVSLPIYMAEGNKKKAMLYTFISALAEPLGAICGLFVLKYFMTDFTLGILLAFTAGVMVYLSIDELLPAAKEYEDSHESVFGVISGMMLMAFSLLFL